MLIKKYFILTVVFSAIILFGVYIFQKNVISINSCSNIQNEAQKIICWKGVIDKDLEKGDLNHTMTLVADTYNSDPDFAKNCHDFMHRVGKTAYDLFSKGTDFKIGSKSSYCAYGFYHGFMENLVSKSGDISLARNFCSKVDNELSKDAPGAKLACYHGIGHGWTNVHDPKFFGNERAMIYPALALCEKITQDPDELKICATGVFDSISISYYNQSDGLKMNKIDPYWLCKEQKDRYKAPCYMDLSPAILWLGDYRLNTSLEYLKTVEPKYMDLVVETIAEDAVRFIMRDNLNIDDQVKYCRNLGSRRNLICLHGLALGYLQFGAPGREEESAIGFCDLKILTESEKDSCYSKIMPAVKSSLSKEKYEKMCSNLPSELTKYCTN
ncbi:MAG TPA: hypothetical protein VFI61_00225 [Patescibacteria group bacterium]|nr:hypothetical protein [Patescibacteria group bacterium]